MSVYDDFKGHPDQHYGHLTFSQHGEDLMIVNLFKLMGIDKPSYLDLGAHHPVDVSNTALLYSRGSRGVNIEANDDLIGAFKDHRVGDINICVGVGPKSGSYDFMMFDDRSGRNTLSFEEFQKTFPGVPAKTRTIVVKTLNEIVEYIECIGGGKWPDFLSCDLEGLDYDTLLAASFGVLDGPKIICVEVRHGETLKFAEMLNRKGYCDYCRMGENMIFVRVDKMVLVRK
jgi:hypothetical protein